MRNKDIKKKNRTSGKFHVIESSLLGFIKSCNEHSLPINSQIIREKALEISKCIGTTGFLASEGWFNMFKSRNKLKVMSTNGSEALVNQNTTPDWRQQVLPEILQNYRPENVYNADETGLYFELLPNKSICLAGASGRFHKDSKLRVTLPLCVNYTGQTKLTPLVVGKSRNPRCFKGVKSLPIVYYSNSSSWMTSKIFNNWLSSLNTDQLKKKQKIA
ncbi:Tigger transposable element-derived protein 4 [Cucumispora dikerogammari]|nr:Tigger transposable element-derived protein 4 [Cucumispora dikerogammari]